MSFAGTNNPLADAGGGDPSSGGNPFANFTPSGLGPRISPTAFTAGIFTVLGISILTILARLTLRLQRTHSLASDDYFLIVALVTLIASCATQQHFIDITYMVANVESGNQIPPQDFAVSSVIETQILDATSVLLWTSIFCVKFSFLFFFRKLISRLRYLQILWWVVFGFVLVSALVCIPLGFIECSYFGEDLLLHCPVDSLIRKERIYLDVTIVLDILTDVMIIALPITLLWNVRIDVVKKLTLIGMFGLSIVMIIIALIRVAMSSLTPNIIDTTWLFFWQIMEASIALIMVSVSAFKSLFGQAGSNGSRGRAYVKHRATRAAADKHAVDDVEKGQESSRAASSTRPMISTPSNFQTIASGLPKHSHAHIDDVEVESIELNRVTPPATAAINKRTTVMTFEELRRDMPAIPGTPRTPGMGYERAESPVTARCWSDSPQLHERTRSLSRAGSVKDAVVRHVRGRSRTPSLGEALIEEREGRTPGTIPRNYV